MGSRESTVSVRMMLSGASAVGWMLRAGGAVGWSMGHEVCPLHAWPGLFLTHARLCVV